MPKGLFNARSGFDHTLVLAAVALVCVSIVMVTSSSLAISDQRMSHAFYFTLRHVAYVMIGMMAALFTLRVPMRTWQRLSVPLFLGSVILLMLVLVPGVGRQVNGSMRWIGAGPITIQVSELAKVGMVLFLARFLERREQEVKTDFIEFVKPLFVLGLVAFLLLLEPDFGAAVVISGTVMGMLFLGGVKIRQFALLSALMLVALSVLAISSPYRVMRLTSFLNPWADQFNSGYQLTQALIAFGRGEWFGVGLGNSVQKLLYLPEAHTDFLLAVIAEELGLVGILVLFGLYVVLIGRILFIGKRAQLLKRRFHAFVAYGIGLWLAGQAIINIGVNAGVLPTKGLTLPLLSYGGSSIVVAFVALAMVLRIDRETRAVVLKNPGSHPRLRP